MTSDNTRTLLRGKEQEAGPLPREIRGIHLIRAAIIGLLAGCVALLLRISVGSVEDLRHQLVALFAAVPTLALLPGVVFLLVWSARIVAKRDSPKVVGSEVSMIKGALLHLRSFPAVARIPVQFISGILALGSGLSLGREGPTVQIGAALGEHYARAHQLSPRSRDNLIACGAGAGLAAAFHAPLAGLLFVIEELHRRLSPIAFGTTIVAVFTADLVNRLTFKQSPSYLLLLYPAPSLATLPLIIIVGVTAGAAGVLFNRTLLASATLGRDIDAKYPLAIPIVTSVVVAAALLFLPETGYNDPAAALRWLLGEFHTDDSILLLLALLGAKFLLTILSFLCRVPGGIITPILAIGGFLGLTIGVMAQRAAPALIPFPGVFGLIGMASLFTAVVRAPLTGIVLILEMTSNHAMLLALVTGTVAAYLTAEHLGDKPIYDALLLEEVVLRGAEGNRTAPPSDAREWPTPPPQANGGSIRELEGEGSTV